MVLVEKRPQGEIVTSETTFWKWLLRDAHGGQSGLAQAFVDVKTLAHMLVGGILAWLTMESALSQLGKDLMLPFAVVLVGLCFASVGNASALLQNPEIERIMDRLAGGMEDSVFGYQFAILSTLAVAVAWGLAVLGIFDELTGAWGLAVRFVLFFLASFSVSQCWGAALFSAEMIRDRYVIRRAEKERDKRKMAKAKAESKADAPDPETKTA